MVESASEFGDKATRSETRIVHVLLEGTHCVQQQFGCRPHRVTHSLRNGIVIDIMGDPLIKTNDWFQNLLKFRALCVFAGHVIVMKANVTANAKLKYIVQILRNDKLLNNKYSYYSFRFKIK